MRRQLEELAHDLIDSKRREEEANHNFAIGSSQTKGTTVDARGPKYAADAFKADEGADQQKTDVTEIPISSTTANFVERETTIGDQPAITQQCGSGETAATANEGSDAAQKLTASPPNVITGATQKEMRGERSNQTAGEAAVEVRVETADEPIENTGVSIAADTVEFDHIDNAKADYAIEQDNAIVTANAGILPYSVVQEIATRAFPLADGVACGAFHALAAEAMWAGFNGLARVEKPPASVWDARGGDRWGTAAFFAEQINEREEESTPGLRRTASSLRGGTDGPGGGEGAVGIPPVTGSSARHAATRRVRLAAVSSRRGFLMEAMRVAANEVQHPTA